MSTPKTPRGNPVSGLPSGSLMSIGGRSRAAEAMAMHMAAQAQAAGLNVLVISPDPRR